MSIGSEWPARGQTASPEISLLTIDRPSFAPHPDPKFDLFIEYWAERAGARGAYPARTDMDPTLLGARLLPNIMIIDVCHERERTRYRYRLLGEEITGWEVTRRGAYLDEVAKSDVSEIERHYAAAICGRIYLRSSTLAWHRPDLDFVRYSTVVLPLAEDGITVSHLLGLCLYQNRVE